jgi:hypothetical protein
MTRFAFIALIVTAMILSFGCGSKENPLSPSPLSPVASTSQTAGNSGEKALWGVWEVTIDTTTWEITAVPLRGTQFTVDVVTFLQKPMGDPANLTLAITDLTNWMTEGLLGVDVGLKHPFPGLDQYTGFDVYGVFVTPGTASGLYDTDVTYTNGADEPKLLNADGYTRWMNPVEFPANGTILRFVPGKLGTPDIGLFTSTINGYKYFADGLGVTQDVADYFADPANVDNRGFFRPGSYNVRDYQLKFPMVGGSPQLVFQYAVIASWVEPDKTLSGDPDVLDVPGDFPFSANANEAIYLKVTNQSSVYYKDGVGGGAIDLQLEVFDWGALGATSTVPDEVYKIVVEGNSSVIPGGFAGFDQATLQSNVSDGTTGISSVFEVEITGCTPKSNDDLPLLITVENTSPDSFDPGTGTPGNTDRLAGYFLTSIPVSTEIPSGFAVTSPNGGETLWMAFYYNITWNPGISGIANVKIEWSTDDFVSDIQTIVASTPNDGSYEWKPIPNVATTTAKVRISDVLGTESDESDGDFTIALPVWLDFQDEVGVSNTTVTWNNYGSLPYEQSYDEISPALSQDIGGMVHMCWFGEIASYQPPWDQWMAHDVTIRSANGTAWNGEGDCLHSEGGTPETPLRTDTLKLAAASNDTTFAAVKIYTSFYCPDVDAWPHGNHSWNWPHGPNIDKNCELMADDLYLYLIGDYAGPGIYCERVPTPNWDWYPTGVVQYTDNGEVSHVRSWAIQDGQLVFAYYTTPGQIKLLRQTDQASDTWDDTEVIFNGAGYTGCKDPSVAVDGDGRLFAVWTGKNSSTSKYEILASMKSTKTGTWSAPIVAASSDSLFNDTSATVSVDKVLLPTGDSEYMVLIGYENNGAIQSRISPKDLWAFLPKQQVNTGTVPTQEPDVLCLQAPCTFDSLFAWSFEVTPGDIGVGDHDIMFRNADFKTP